MFNLTKLRTISFNNAHNWHKTGSRIQNKTVKVKRNAGTSLVNMKTIIIIYNACREIGATISTTMPPVMLRKRILRKCNQYKTSV